jgi:glycosyltransferase involved in cell wall biosynthesis
MQMDDHPIELSVIMPTYRRPEIVRKCLRAFGAQTLSCLKFEVLVVDDGSPQGLEEIVRSAVQSSSLNACYLYQANSGANAARNRGIAAAKGKILLFINDDTIPTSAMLEEHLKTHREYPDESVAVLGRVTIAPEVPYSLFAKLHLDAGYQKLEGRRKLDWRAFYTCNVSVKRSFLEKYGFFEEKMRYHEDTELGQRLSGHGLQVIYHPEALGHHDHYLQEDEYLGIAEREGRSLAVWHGKAPHLKRELSEMGFYPAKGAFSRAKYRFADALVSVFGISRWIRCARYFAERNERLSLFLYRKVFQALKRSSIRQALGKGV